MKSRTLPKSLTDALRPRADLALVSQLASELEEAMRLIHGGDWYIVIDHEVGFVMVRQQ